MEAREVLRDAIASRWAMLNGMTPRGRQKRAEWYEEVQALEKLWDETFDGDEGEIRPYAKSISRPSSVKAAEKRLAATADDDDEPEIEDDDEDDEDEVSI